MKQISEAQNASLVAEVDALRHMTVAELAEKWKQVFGRAPRTLNRQHLWRRLAWQIQANVYGGLSEPAKERIQELIPEALAWWGSRHNGSKAKEPPKPTSGTSVRDARLPQPGTILTRRYKGARIEVEVLAQGFAYEGRPYRSLSAIAKEITGAHWNGFLFFGLAKGKRR